MPNFCENLVTFSHPDPNMIKRVVDANNEGCLFQEFVPCPEELSENGGWYDWQITNWGTKWDISDYDDAEIYDPNEVQLFFTTAWTPPISFYEKMEEMGFSIDAQYYEPGVGFCGSYKDSEDDYIEIAGDSKWAKQNIPEEINEIFDIVANLEYWENDESE